MNTWCKLQVSCGLKRKCPLLMAYQTTPQIRSCQSDSDGIITLRRRVQCWWRKRERENAEQSFLLSKSLPFSPPIQQLGLSWGHPRLLILKPGWILTTLRTYFFLNTEFHSPKISLEGNSIRFTSAGFHFVKGGMKHLG